LAGKDEYWTLYYFKPFSRIHSYMIGVFLGTSYFTYKCEEKRIQKPNVIVQYIQSAFLKIKENNMLGTLSVLSGLLI